MPTPNPALTERLDQLETSLPAIPARLVHLQRTLAGAACDTTSAVWNAVTSSTRQFLDTAKVSGKSVTGQARAAATGSTALLDSAIDAIDDQPGSGQPYEQWTKAQLLERAKELDIEGRYGLDKRGLIAALRSA